MLYNKDKSRSDQADCLARPGRFISFEGIDGSGKSTQISLLAEKLSAGDKEFCLLREPGGTPIGEAIRHILLDKQNTAMYPETELLLFAAARAQLVRQVIMPQLAAGKWIVCDRFYDSTTAYQGYGRSVDQAALTVLNQLAVAGCRPDLTILLDLDPELALARLQSRSEKQDRFDKESIAFMHKIRQGYLELAAQEPDRMIVIDATQKEEQLAEQIYNKIREGLA